jgi:hypothetical protein
MSAEFKEKIQRERLLAVAPDGTSLRVVGWAEPI